MAARGAQYTVLEIAKKMAVQAAQEEAAFVVVNEETNQTVEDKAARSVDTMEEG